jgi:hypothetical protein
MKRVNRNRLLIAAALLLSAACDREAPRPAAASAPPALAAVDSAIPPDLALAGFRADLGTPPTDLRGARRSIDTLIADAVRALALSDTAAFEPLAMDRAEFAYLYYPASPFAHEPYELPPGLVWMQIQETNRASVFRALGSYGGREWRYLGYRCAPGPALQGRNRIWSDCVVAMGAGADTVRARLVGRILERDGRFKVLSYATDG